jgi:hypothetical protein
MERSSKIATMPQMLPLPQPWILPDVALAWYSRVSNLETLAAGFLPISLNEMDAVALLDRIDIKFVMTQEQLLCVLAGLQTDYWMLAVNGKRLNHYRTLYFDTQNFEFYNAHVNGRVERYKVRSREYTDSNLSFVEVKHKTRKDRTIKQRISTLQTVMRMTPEIQGWLEGVSPLDGSLLEPKLWNTFTRITLVSKRCCERVTLDIDLTFSTGDRVAQLDNVAIAEVKMAMGDQTSPFLARMRAQRIRQRGFSKYSIGVCMLFDQVKKNSLKPTMLWVEKMMKGTAQ